MPSHVTHRGSLVALEGSPDVVSTQLRLLPTAPHISILPSVQYYLEEATQDDDQDVFDTKAFVKKVYSALQTRHDVARTFLKDSTPSSKKLVFAHGGTAGAYLFCVRTIAESQTGGDLVEAEAVLNDIIKHGTEGLEEDFVEFQSLRSENLDNPPNEDPAFKAMRAAEALDRLTACLQPDDNDMDLKSTPKPRQRRLSLPLYTFDDRFGDAAPFYMFGVSSTAAPGEYDDASATPTAAVPPNVSVMDYDPHGDDGGRIVPFASCLDLSERSSVPPSSPSCIGESYNPCFTPTTPMSTQTVGLVSPKSDMFSIRSIEPTVYGRPSMVQMKPLTTSSKRRANSLDENRSVASGYLDEYLHSPIHSPFVIPEEYRASDEPSPRSLATPTQTTWSSVENMQPPLPARFASIRSERPTITLDPVPPKSKKKTLRPSCYVDRATDTDDSPVRSSPFQPVFAVQEDLSINLKDAAPDFTLSSVLESFKTKRYPVQAPPTASIKTSVSSSSQIPTNDYEHVDDDDDLSAPGTPTFSAAGAETQTEPAVQDQLTPSKGLGIDTDEYDPFAYDTYTTKPATRAIHVAQTIKAVSPPTPARTDSAPPSVLEVDERFRDCDIADCKTAIAVQNTLRSSLSVHFPSDDEGYHHLHFSVLPEMGGLWKPIFTAAESDISSGEARRVDQIFAVGAQRGVKKAFSSGIIGQLEELGRKPGELSRSGRLDFRYLVANAMQAFTAQPLANQAHDNPFTNKYLLATQIIPHLETYFAVHDEVRFLLLEYTPDHLPTVLALQKLIGVDLMKVAQVVDSNPKDPMPFTHVRGSSTGGSGHARNASTSSSFKARHRRHGSSSVNAENVAISKANFLLTSQASETEISNFVQTVRKLLSGVSGFYLEKETKKKVVRKPAPLTSTFSPFPRSTIGPQSPPLSPPPRSPPPPITRPLPPPPPSPEQSVRAPSMTASYKTSRSGPTRRPKSSKSQNRVTDVGSLYTFKLEDDSDYDDDERRLMPLFVEQPANRKGNSRKALKFLGLA